MKNSILIIFLFANVHSFAQRVPSVYRFKIDSIGLSITNQAIDSTISVLKKRLQNIGYKNPTIAYNNGKREFSIECDSSIAEEFINNWLLKPCKVIFYETYNRIDVISVLLSYQDHDKNLDKKKEFCTLLNISNNNINERSSDLGVIKISDSVKFNLLKKELKTSFTKDCLFAFQKNNELTNDSVITIFALKNNAEKIILNGSLDSVGDFIGYRGEPALRIRFNKVGTEKFAKMTRKNIDKAIAIVVDELVYSAPFVNGEIEGGRADISGGFTAKEAKQLANMMSGGYLPIRLTLIK